MKKSNLIPSLVLGAICLVVAVLLSAINMITAPIIEERQNQAANEALLEVLPNGKNFVEIELTEDYPDVVTAGYKADGGFVFQMSVIGKSAGLVIMCGIDADGKVVSTKVIANEETPGYAAKVFPEVEGSDGKYKGMGLDGFEAYLVSGATLTSKAYGEAIKAALQSAVLAAGGSVDTRTPEQILQDSCNAALGTTGKTFTKWFETEEIVGVDSVYKCDAGYVMIIGDKYIGVNNSGATVLTATADGATVAVSAEDKAVVDAVYALVSGSVLTEITLPADTDKNITKAYITASGNYVFEVRGEGYKHESLKEYAGVDDAGYINIKVSISADGKIIDCVTVSHEESKGYGDACATEEYYEQYKGKENADINVTVSAPDFEEDLIAPGNTDVGAIASSTFTTYGYQTAIKLAFETFEALTAEGGND